VLSQFGYQLSGMPKYRAGVKDAGKAVCELVIDKIGSEAVRRKMLAEYCISWSRTCQPALCSLGTKVGTITRGSVRRTDEEMYNHLRDRRIDGQEGVRGERDVGGGLTTNQLKREDMALKSARSFLLRYSFLDLNSDPGMHAKWKLKSSENRVLQLVLLRNGMTHDRVKGLNLWAG
jgi:hypothetical protein